MGDCEPVAAMKEIKRDDSNEPLTQEERDELALIARLFGWLDDDEEDEEASDELRP